MKSFLLLIATSLLFFISCEKPKNSDFFDTNNKITIYSIFDECGEWGGHKEKFEIFDKDDNEFYANYIKTKVNCNNISENYGTSKFQEPHIYKTFKLNDFQKTEIVNYFHNLVNSKISERFPGHSGKTFGVQKDSTFVIEVYDINSKNVINYNRLLKSFKLDTISN